MTDVKQGEKVTTSTKWNKAVLDSLGVAKLGMNPGEDLHIQLCAKGLAVVKNGMKCGVTNGKRMVLDVSFESVVVLENGWMVACKNGIYNLYNEEGTPYKGLSFLNKQNAIKFAKSL